MRFRFLSCLCVMVSLAFPAVAESVSYTIQDVEVQAKAADGTTARMEAMTKAEKDAFKQLMENLLTPEDAAARIASTQEYQISRMVRGYEVHNEKVGGNSYTAKLDVTFDPAQVQAFLNKPAAGAAPTAPATATAQALPAPAAVNVGATPPVASVPVSIQSMRSNVLVLPVLTTGTQHLLWEDNNAWRNAWNQAERSDTQFIRLPIGDQSDQLMMAAEMAPTSPYASFSPIAERYQAGTVIVAEAMPSPDVTGGVLTVRLRSLGMQGQNNGIDLTYNQTADETQEALLHRAAQDIIGRIMQEGQQRSMQQVQSAAPRSKLTVLSRLNQLGDWVVLRKRLLSLPVVEAVELSAISSQQADMVVVFRGSPEQLETSMASQGLKVNKAYNYWVVGF